MQKNTIFLSLAKNYATLSDKEAEYSPPIYKLLLKKQDLTVHMKYNSAAFTNYMKGYLKMVMNRKAIRKILISIIVILFVMFVFR